MKLQEVVKINIRVCELIRIIAIRKRFVLKLNVDRSLIVLRSFQVTRFELQNVFEPYRKVINELLLRWWKIVKHIKTWPFIASNSFEENNQRLIVTIWRFVTCHQSVNDWGELNIIEVVIQLWMFIHILEFNRQSELVMNVELVKLFDTLHNELLEVLNRSMRQQTRNCSRYILNDFSRLKSIH